MSAQDPVAAFRIEAGDLLDQVEQALLDLNSDLSDKTLVDAIFRGLHTLKGSGAMFGFDALAQFTHHCESAFDKVRKGQVPATRPLVDVILSAQDHMRALVDLEEGADPTATGDAILARLQAALGESGDTDADHGGAESKAGEASESTGAKSANGWRLSFRLPADAMVNGTNPLMLLDELRELGDCVIRARTDTIPLLPDLVATECHLAWDVELRGDVSREAIDDVFIFVMDDMELEIEALPAQPEQADEPVADCEASEPSVADVPETKVEAVDAPASRKNPATPPKMGENVRVPAERLDELMDRVGELVIAQSRLSQIADGGQNGDMALHSISEEIERLAGALRDTMMVLRMMPVANLFSRFRRLIHDLSQETGKAIELTTSGEETEVDKTVIERLFDPLVHVIRNSCDHGLESPEDRVAAGKPRAGRVSLTAQQAGGEVLITIEDDGRGIDREKVRAKAETQGLLQPGQQISDKDLLSLIFHPGFSTAAQVTNLSGRGVGMDVVKRTIESLRGSIDVASVPGAGSTITLRIPLTLAIIQGLLVRVGEGSYVIPLAAVEECIELSLEEDMRSRGRSLINLRDRLVPFLRLRDLFATGTRPDTHQKIVIVAVGKERVGLVVDQIIGNHQTVIKSLSAFHRGLATFSGATILGDGNVALILDVAHLVALGQADECREKLHAAG